MLTLTDFMTCKFKVKKSQAVNLIDGLWIWFINNCNFNHNRNNISTPR